MNIFKQVEQVKAVADSKKRGSNVSLKSTVSIPYFKGLYRKGDCYSVKIGKGKKASTLSVKPLTGAFIISYAVCLSHSIVVDENRHIDANNFAITRYDIEQDKAQHVVLSSYLVEVVLSSEGFSLDDYKQGKTAGARRIEQHIKAIAEQRELPLTVQDSVIQGVTNEIASAVLSAI